MNLEQAKKKMNKINRLLDTIEPDESPTSRLERDLLLNYIRELYESVLENSDADLPSSGTLSFKPTTAESIAPQKPANNPESRQKEETETLVQQPVEKKHAPEPQTITETEPEPVQETEPVQEAPIEKPKVEKKAAKPRPVEATEEKPIEKSQKASISKAPKTEETKVETLIAEKVEEEPEVEELFTIKKANEISEKLSQLPISDLNRAMGVNEKIFVKNELFAGDDNVFRQVIQKLNTLNSFEDAKNFLSSEVAYTYQWTDPDKKNKAKNFIQLVYRRYKDN
ncbi:MAG: hypothetical protein EA411_06700 [Saprospirales bacterium]|nr:MAG: hypothetical protein EA411_06700 [Saprospirales bacterium]